MERSSHDKDILRSIVLFIGRLSGRLMLRALVEYLDIELPTLDMFSGFLACDDNYELGDLAANHPFV